MTENDTLNIADSLLLQKDSFFIPEYIKCNPDYMKFSDSADITCKNYICSLFKETGYKQEKRNTLFVEKLSYDRELKLTAVEKESNDVFFFVYLFMLLLLSVLLKYGYKLIVSFISGCFSINQLKILTKGGTTTNIVSLLSVIFIFLPVFALLLYNTVSFYGINIPVISVAGYSLCNKGVGLFVLIYISCVIMFLLKLLMIQFVAWVFKERRMSAFYIQMHLNFGNLMGMCLFLPVFCIIYSQKSYHIDFIILSLLIFGLLYIIRICRSFYVIIKEDKFSHVYLFFYLCILEILPLILLVKQILF